MHFGPVEILKGINLDVPEGEFLTLLGPSGCGKTTLLRIVAGFLDPSYGSVIIKDKNVTKVPPYARGVGMVFQNYAVWPHKNVEQHLTFGLKLAKLDAKTIKERTEWALGLVGLTGLEKRFPSELSGGQQQRVALARAICMHPTLLLLDEPLSNLDRKLRDDMRLELRQLQQNLGITAIYVTHDQTEALTMSDRIVVMHQGVIEQIATPRDLYDRPANVFVSKFLGAGNLASVKVHRFFQGKATLFFESKEITIPVSNLSFNSDKAYLLLRPENIEFTNCCSDVKNCINGTVKVVIFEGKEIRYTVALDNSQLVLDIVSSSATEYAVGDRVGLSITKSVLIPIEGGQSDAIE
jgi:ABC-type Fe3+/spermidine/putrescine transport system ATPase subunit